MDQAEIKKLQDATAWDSRGKKLGEVNHVHLENESGIPAWITVSLGLLNTRRHYIPLADSRFEGEDLHVAWTRDQITDSPTTISDMELTPAEESGLIDYYRLRGDTTSV
ncbi:hypothetical protein AC792_12425 [Arthrobacter sp. RIT-PI-e]|uniref:PRC-barrel domain-containing protein n=1 Tax=Arthrobacter sp. RIT-PI-e TaxID=1681197 RepID=UPI000675E805|nr:PRC-barrel domain-containing protein [Arthrobacter sp. RIT-PI-e]KNC18475.1 hypothetical protein AC792_12425 [Arthrobacter sp. RIT-PI-e]